VPFKTTNKTILFENNSLGFFSYQLTINFFLVEVVRAKKTRGRKKIKKNKFTSKKKEKHRRALKKKCRMCENNSVG